VSAESPDIESKATSDSTAIFYLEPRIYDRETILRTSYWFTDIAFIQISPSSTDNRICVELRLKQSKPTLASPECPRLEDVVGEFCNSLLDFELRRQVDVETAPVRQLILAKAFSESGILENEPPGALADPVELGNPSTFTKIIGQPPRSDRGKCG
jgi:His-Xaa-Ser system protein HxsD